MSDICTVGMGFVGIPLSLAFDSAGHDVIGFDIDDERIHDLERGRDPTGKLSPEQFERSEVTYTTDPQRIQGCEYVIITVPTPVDEWEQPNLDAVANAGRTVGENLSNGTTVVLESTVYPGATRDKLVPALENASGMNAGTDFSVGYSPERITPSEADQYNIHKISKIVSGQDDETLDDLRELYESIIDATVHPAPSIETAEAAKCLENVQRDVNIALINEFVMGCDRLSVDIDPRDVLSAAQTKPGFHDYHSGLVGGHCIPVDPYFLISRFKKDGFDPRIIESARQTNESFPKFVAERTIQRLTNVESRYSNDVARSRQQPERASGNSRNSRPVETATGWEPRILILGFSYKANTNDIRNDALGHMIEELKRYGTTIYGYDPNVESSVIEDHFDVHALDEPSSEFDSIIVTALHDEFQEYELGRIEAENELPVVVDLTGYFERSSPKKLAV